MLKSLIRFHSANKIDNYNKGDKEKEKRNPKERSGRGRNGRGKILCRQKK